MSDSQKWLVVVAFLGCSVLLYLLAPVLTPFLLGALLAYLGDPLVDRLERWRVGRTVGVVIVFAAMLCVGVIGLLVLLPMLERQVASLVEGVPRALEWLQTSLAPRVAGMLGTEVVDFDIAGVREALVDHWRQVGSFASVVVKQLSHSGQLLLGWAAYLLLVPVVTFYLLRDWDHLVAAIDSLLPKRFQPTVAKLARQIDAVLAEFLRGQLVVMLALAVLYTLGLWLVGLKLALFIGVLSGIVSFVPYLGIVVGIVLAGFAVVVQFGDLSHLLAVVAVFGVGQLLEGMVLSPLLVGDRIGLHPVAVIFAALAGGQLFGFLGILLALPMAAIIVVLLRHSRTQYLQSSLYD
jgi:predicted PurR-regulated permease PerM